MRSKMAESNKEITKSRIAWAVAYILAIFWLLVALVPFMFMIFNSLRQQFDMLQQGPLHLPDPWYFDNYPQIVKNGIFGYFGRSVLIVSLSLVLMLIISSFAAYPLSRMKFRLRNFLYAGIIAMMSVPMHVTLIPIFKMTNAMGLYNNLFSLLGPYVAFALPMAVFILTVEQREEALEKTMWNEFAFANTFLNTANQKTLPLALGQFKGEFSMDMPMILSVLVLSALPMIILFIIFQDKLVKGMMAGAVKG